MRGLRRKGVEAGGGGGGIGEEKGTFGVAFLVIEASGALLVHWLIICFCRWLYWEGEQRGALHERIHTVLSTSKVQIGARPSGKLVVGHGRCL